MTFNPLATARQILAETDLTDPDDIAAAIFDRTPESEITDVYKRLLRTAAREAVRIANMDASAPPAPQVQGKQLPNRSSRVAAIRDTHIGYYDQRVFANGDWKLLRDCTREDVLDLAQQRQEIADRNLAKAAEYQALAARMETAGVEFAGQLEKGIAA